MCLVILVGTLGSVPTPNNKADQNCLVKQSLSESRQVTERKEKFSHLAVGRLELRLTRVCTHPRALSVSAV